MSPDLNPIQKAILEKFDGMTMREVNAFLNGGSPAIKRGPGRPPTVRSEPKATPERRVKRSAEQIAQEANAVLQALTVVLAKHSDGLRSEELQKESGFGKEAIAEATKLGVESGLLGKVGERRATKYLLSKSSGRAIPPAQAELPTLSAQARGVVVRRKKKAR